MSLPSNERCLFFGHLFKMDERKRRRYCARCGVLEIDHAIEYLSSLQQTRGQQQFYWIDSGPPPQANGYLWGGRWRNRQSGVAVPSRILKVEGNVITVRFGGKT